MDFVCPGIYIRDNNNGDDVRIKIEDINEEDFDGRKKLRRGPLCAEINSMSNSDVIKIRRDHGDPHFWQQSALTTCINRSLRRQPITLSSLVDEQVSAQASKLVGVLDVALRSIKCRRFPLESAIEASKVLLKYLACDGQYYSVPGQSGTLCFNFSKSYVKGVLDRTMNDISFTQRREATIRVLEATGLVRRCWNKGRGDFPEDKIFHHTRIGATKDPATAFGFVINRRDALALFAAIGEITKLTPVFHVYTPRSAVEIERGIRVHVRRQCLEKGALVNMEGLVFRLAPMKGEYEKKRGTAYGSKFESRKKKGKSHRYWASRRRKRNSADMCETWVMRCQLTGMELRSTNMLQDKHEDEDYMLFRMFKPLGTMGARDQARKGATTSRTLTYKDVYSKLAAIRNKTDKGLKYMVWGLDDLAEDVAYEHYRYNKLSSMDLRPGSVILDAATKGLGEQTKFIRPDGPYFLNLTKGGNLSVLNSAVSDPKAAHNENVEPEWDRRWGTRVFAKVDPLHLGHSEETRGAAMKKLTDRISRHNRIHEVRVSNTKVYRNGVIEMELESYMEDRYSSISNCHYHWIEKGVWVEKPSWYTKTGVPPRFLVDAIQDALSCVATHATVENQVVYVGGTGNNPIHSEDYHMSTTRFENMAENGIGVS